MLRTRKSATFAVGYVTTVGIGTGTGHADRRKTCESLLVCYREPAGWQVFLVGGGCGGIFLAIILFN